MHDIENVLSDTAFRTAFAVAAIGTGLVWFRVRRDEFEPGVAFVVVVAGLVGLRVEHRLPAALVVALALLAFGEYLAREAAAPVRLLALFPGALVLGASLPDGWPFWMRAAAAGAALGGGLLAVETDRVAPRLVPVLLGVSALGVYLCVPDTEAPKALLGAALAATVLALEPRLQHRIGVAALTGLVVWVSVYGGLGRAGSVVGGIACLGALVLLPLVPRWSPTRLTTPVVIVVQCALVSFVSRVAGFAESGWSALVLAIPAFVVAWVVLALLRRRVQ